MKKLFLMGSAILAMVFAFMGKSNAQTNQAKSESETVVLAFTPVSGSELMEDESITIELQGSLTDSTIYFAIFNTREEAEAATDATMIAGSRYGEAPADAGFMDRRKYKFPKAVYGSPVIKAGFVQYDSVKEDGILIEINTTYHWFYAEYTVNPLLVFTPASGETVNEGDTVKITVLKQGINTWYFNTYASLEEAQEEEETNFDGDGFVDKATLYDEAKGNVPVITAEKPVIRAGYTYFDIATVEDVYRSYYATYIVDASEVTADTVIMPIFSHAAGIVEKGTEITLTCATSGAMIYYTLDGEEPTAESTEYDEAIVINETTTIKAIATMEGMVSSKVASITYEVEQEIVIEPIEFTFDPEAGSEVEENTQITITASRDLEEDENIIFAMFATKAEAEACTTEEMVEEGRGTIYGEPVEGDDEVGYPIITAAAPVLKVGYMSDIDEEGNLIFDWTYAEYTVKVVSNQEAELAGVAVYPNPSDGLFSISVPVQAQVEVFTATGMMVKNFTAAEGIMQLRLKNTGIYFVRFTVAEGKQTIKRVVVR